MTTNKLTENVLFDLARALELIDTLGLAVESATMAEDERANAEIVKRLDADENYIKQTHVAIREAQQWVEALRDNSVVMLRFQRYVDAHIGKSGS